MDAVNAKHIAHGFGISDSDITCIEDLPLNEINSIIIKTKKELKGLARQGKRSFLFVYGAGHGVADQEQYMILHSTSGNLFPIE